MMDDHFQISAARHHLSDALRALLKAELMTKVDFQASRDLAMQAVEQLDDLLRLPDRDEAKP